jgi:hypothetical protein
LDGRDPELAESNDTPASIDGHRAPEPGPSPCSRGVPLILPNGEVDWVPVDCSPQNFEPGDPSPELDDPMRDPRLEDMLSEVAESSTDDDLP